MTALTSVTSQQAAAEATNQNLPSNTLTLIPATTTEATPTTRKLYIYRLSVKLSGTAIPPPQETVANYFVEAPTQCSATRYTALRPEVSDIMLVELWTKDVTQALTFSTDKDCP